MGKEQTANKPTQKELSYDELKNVAGQLQQQNKFLTEQLMKKNYEELYRRIDYLFKVLENKTAFEPTFVDYCAEELTSVLTVTPEDIKEIQEKVEDK